MRLPSSNSTFVLQLFKILRFPTRASALKIENVHSTKRYGTLSSGKLLADSKKSAWFVCLEVKKVKNSGIFPIFFNLFP
jgi:hypothetical protein